jgi:hypothetical protein
VRRAQLVVLDVDVEPLGETVYRRCGQLPVAGSM